MILVRENISFERGLDAKEALGVGEISKIKKILSEIDSDPRTFLIINERHNFNRFRSVTDEDFIEIIAETWHWSEPSSKALMYLKIINPLKKYIQDKVNVNYKQILNPSGENVKASSILKVKDEYFDLFKKIKENGFS